MSDYPELWLTGDIQQAIYNLAGWRCEHCGMEFVTGTTKAKTARNRKGKPMILTVHHLNGDKSDCRWQNLLCCCQRCHLSIQAKWRIGGVLPLEWGNVPRWLSERKLDYIQLGLEQKALL